MSFSKAPSIKAVAVAGVTAVALGGSLTSCAQEVNEDVYCATEDGTVLDPEYCDSDSGRSGAFIWIGNFGGSYGPGDRLSGGERFRYDDTAKRAQYGLPKTGKPYSSGTGKFGGKTTYSKGGGFGGVGKGSGGS